MHVNNSVYFHQMVEKWILIIAAIPAFLFLLYIIFRKRKQAKALHPLNNEDRAILNEYVDVYQALDNEKQVEFEKRMQHFLSTTRITGVIQR